MADIFPILKNDAVYGPLLAKFRKDIHEERLAGGSLLPGEKEIARTYGLSRWAVREMLAKLADDGLVRKIAGKGTVVVERKAEERRRGAIALDFIIDNTNKLDANEYAMDMLHRIRLTSQMMRRPFDFSYRLLDFSGRQPEDQESICKVAADASVIIPFSRPCRDFLEMLPVMDRLVIAVAAELSTTRVPQVFVDDVEGVRKGTRYLHQLGHRRIAMIAPTDYCYRNGYSRIRQETFIEEMRLAGCDWTSEMTERVEYSYAPVRAVVTRWMGRSDAPTAFFVGDGNWLSPVRSALEGLGKRIPHDITVISYDDVMESRAYDPPVTVVRQPLETAARKLCEVIIDHVEGHPPVQVQHRIAPELIVRESSCPPGWLNPQRTAPGKFPS